jgi:voltage-gated potassium channel
MILLASVMLVLFSVHLALPLSPFGERRIKLVEWLIWQVFLLEFAVNFLLAHEKRAFLRQNWLMGLALLLPVLRVLHVLTALPALTGTPTLHALAVTDRGLRKLAVLLARQRLLYLLALVITGVFSSAAGEYLVEANVPGATIRSYGDALWWAAGTVTSVGTELYPVTAEGRIIAVATMFLGVSIFGYVAASIAALFVGVDASKEKARDAGKESDPEIAALREEMRRLQEQMDALIPLLRGR